MEEEKNIYKGIVKEEEKIYPAYINLKNSKYIEIDNLYYAGLICIDYYKNTNRNKHKYEYINIL